VRNPRPERRLGWIEHRHDVFPALRLFPSTNHQPFASSRRANNACVEIAIRARAPRPDGQIDGRKGNDRAGGARAIQVAPGAFLREVEGP
jgi:hypothetical protein